MQTEDTMLAATQPARREEYKPDIVLDRIRSFYSVHPPEQLTCAGGKSIATAFAEERPALYRQFEAHAESAGHDIRTKTRCYEQDGFSFDADGKIILEAMDKAAVERARKLAIEREAMKAARRAHAEFMRSQGFSEEQFRGFEDIKPAEPATANSVAKLPGEIRDEGGTGSEAPLGGEKNTFDIVGWAKGNFASQWFAVVKAFREQYGVAVRDRAHAEEWLVEHGVVTRAMLAKATT